MIKETIKKYGQIILAFTLIIIIYMCLTNISAIAKFVGNLLSILFPFLLGILFVLLSLIPCKFIESKIDKTKFKFIKKHKRGISILICYSIAFIIITLFIRFAIKPISDNIAELISNIPIFYNNIIIMLTNIPENSIFYGIDVNFIIENISIEKIQSYLNMDTIMTYAKGVFNAATVVLSIFIAIIISIYILFDKERIKKFIKRFVNATFNEKIAERVTKYIRKTITIFLKFINAQFLDALIVGTCSTIILLILNVKYALILGPLIGIANMIPYFGAIFATIFAVLLTLLTGGFWKALSVLILIIVLQQIDANIINPKIMSDNLKISPLLVILAVTIGGGFFGVIGMFLGVPIMAVIKMIVMDYISVKEKKKQKNAQLI